MVSDSVGRNRKRAVHLYLREDILEALERVAAEGGISVSRVVEIILAFYLELNTLAEKWRFLAEANRRFRTST